MRALRGQFSRITLVAFFVILIMQCINYVWYKSVARTGTEAALESMAAMKKAAIESYTQQLSYIANSICYQESVQRLVRQDARQWMYDTSLKEIVVSLLQNMTLFKGEIINIDIVDSAGTYLAGSANAFPLFWYSQNAKSMPTEAYFSDLYQITSTSPISTPLMCYFTPINNSSMPDFGEGKGTIIICFNMNGLVKLMRESGPGDSQFILLDENGVIMAAARRMLLDTDASDYLHVTTGMKYVAQPLNGHCVLSTEISGTNWTLISIAPEYEFMQNEYRMFILSAILLLAGLILMIGMYSISNRKIVSDVRYIMDLISSPDNTKDTPNTGQAMLREFQMISDTYRAVSAERRRLETELSESARRSYERDIQAKQWEIDALRNQIRPHFLYNTLEHLRGMALYYGADVLNRQIEELAMLLRYSMQPCVLSTVEQEVAALMRYAHILEMRSGIERVAVHIDLEPGLNERPMPRLLLHPLVENSVQHGLRNRLTGGVVDVRISAWPNSRADNDANVGLLIAVRDNGEGMDKERLSQILASIRSGKRGENGIGLNFISNGLRLLYGERASLDIRSVPGRFTEILIIIPGEAMQVEQSPDRRG